MTIEKQKFMDWLEGIQDYYAWNESEYHMNQEYSASMAKIINEMRMALVMDVDA